ncbi:DUF4922 domain-containing protein [Dysgonomonas sp. HGC4]|uniref:DUF4922 domain-containing protein n=1 Tax=Dysgonomonas sp. HGC4 TaxID=1658009 RepID=UPI0006817585|nr:DUF4922 domain-containing protein [Dysgonomonas sp. HGC4]MBD8347419.1 DUF4922 domain-containing protein [Dysgonomonas sp. HGC4]
MKTHVTSDDAKSLLLEQLQEWEQARLNYEALANVESKEKSFDGFVIKVQFNPGRIQSSAAKVDTKSIQERKCFLCPANLPLVQKGIPFENTYQILVNPFPIFPQHFTIPTYEHVDQLVLNRYKEMLALAKDLNEYTFFYNGPKCGASAPDHAHFQAGSKGFMPIEEDVKQIDKEIVLETEGLTVSAFKKYLRNGFLIEAEDKDRAVDFFKELYSLQEIKEGEKEPMMNIISWYEDGKWFSCIFPRAKHRPACFFAEGDYNILISPASVDLGGVLITPLEKDFNKITSKDIETILKEVCISDVDMMILIKKIKDLPK